MVKKFYFYSALDLGHPTKNFILRKFFIALFILFSLFSCSNLLAQTESEKELFLVAQKSFDDGFYDVAIRYIQQFVEKYPQSEKNIQAKLLLGQSYFFKGQYLKAYDTFQKLLPYSELKDATIFWLGETHLKGGDYKQAEGYYRQLLDVYPSSAYVPQAYHSLAWTHFERKDYTQAKEIFQKLLQKFPAHPLSEEAHFKIAECEYFLEQYETAIPSFLNYLDRYSQLDRQAQAYFYIAESYYYLKNFLTAVTYYAKAAEISYDFHVVFMAKLSMGWSYLKLGKHDLSEKYFVEAEKLAEEKKILSDDIYLGKANLYSELENHPQALVSYDTLLQKFPQSPRLAEAYLGKANIHYLMEDYDSAIKAYQKIVEAYAQDSERKEILEKAHYGLAWTYLKKGQTDLAIQNFQNVLEGAENKMVKVSALTQMADAYHEIGELEKAINVYDKILSEYPDSLYTDYAQFRQGLALLKLNRIEAALLSFQTLQANFPTSKHLNEARYYLAVVYFQKRDWVQTIRYAQAYLQGLPRSEAFVQEAQYFLGLSQFYLLDHSKALDTFQELLKDPSLQPTMRQLVELNIGKCFFELGQIKPGLQQMEMILEKDPDSVAAQEALVKLGDFYLSNQEFVKAISYYEKFLQQFPGAERIPWVYYDLGQAYQQSGQLDRAVESYQKIGEKAPQELLVKAKLAVAEIFSRDADVSVGVQAYLELIEKMPEFQRSVHMKIAEMYNRNKQYQDALDTYQKALAATSSSSEIANVEIQFAIADVYESLRQREKAVESYLKIPYLYPKDAPWVIKAYLRVARIFEEQEKWEEAKTVYHKIVEFNTEESKYAQEQLERLREK